VRYSSLLLGGRRPLGSPSRRPSDGHRLRGQRLAELLEHQREIDERRRGPPPPRGTASRATELTPLAPGPRATHPIGSSRSLRSVIPATACGDQTSPRGDMLVFVSEKFLLTPDCFGDDVAWIRWIRIDRGGARGSTNCYRPNSAMSDDHAGSGDQASAVVPLTPSRARRPSDQLGAADLQERRLAGRARAGCATADAPSSSSAAAVADLHRAACRETPGHTINRWSAGPRRAAIRFNLRTTSARITADRGGSASALARAAPCATSTRFDLPHHVLLGHLERLSNQSPRTLRAADRENAHGDARLLNRSQERDAGLLLRARLVRNRQKTQLACCSLGLSTAVWPVDHDVAPRRPSADS